MKLFNLLDMYIYVVIFLIIQSVKKNLWKGQQNEQFELNNKKLP